MSPDDTYTRFLAMLDAGGARYRVIEHAPEGRTEVVSGLRGHALAQAAKCIILMAKLDKKTRQFLLGVVPGNARIDFQAVKALAGASYVGFADAATAEELGGCPVGSILPFALDERLRLIADPLLLAHEELFFNAARLDRSVALATADYVRLASPKVAPITLP